jgi:dimethylglycine dehydrogenase
MDVFINWNKDFVGKDATLKFRKDGVPRRLVTLTIDTAIDVSLDEAILKDGNAVGYISSGGYAHHVGRSMAMGYVESCLRSAWHRAGCRDSGRVFLSRRARRPTL